MKSSLRRAAWGAAVITLLLSADTALFACPVCFRVDEGPAAAGVRAAVLVLMGVTFGVLIGFAVFVRRLVRRS